MYLLSAGLIEAGLRAAGITGANARKLAHTVMDDFHEAGSPQSSSDQQLRETVAQVVGAIVAMRNATQRSFLKLPDRAPALWGNREDRLPGENSIEFLGRVWGRYLDAGVLYQDQLRHLGETKLYGAIHAYCRHHGLDHRNYAPPPKHVRFDRAREAVDPDSPEGYFYRVRFEQRTSMRRLYEKRARTP